MHSDSSTFSCDIISRGIIRIVLLKPILSAESE